MKSQRKSIVFLLGNYYPDYSAVGKCLGNIADILSKKHDVTVISLKNSIEQNNQISFNNQTILRCSFKTNDLRLNLEYDDSKKKGFFSITKHLSLKLMGFINFLQPTGSAKNDWTKAYTNSLFSLTRKIDLLIPTCNPFETVLASLAYKNKNPRTVVMPFLFDLYAGNGLLNKCKLFQALKFQTNINQEHKMFESSKKVLCVNNWKAHVLKYHYDSLDRIIFVEHPLLVRTNDVIRSSWEKDKEIHIVYTGIVDSKNRNPEYILSLFSKIKTENTCMDFYAYGSAEETLRKFAETNSAFHFKGKVSSEVANRARQFADVLLSIGNRDYSQIPSKLFEYFSVGKPIIHIADSVQDPAIAILDNYPVKLILLKTDSFDINNYKLISFLKNDLSTPISLEEIFDRYQYACPEIVAKIFENELK